MDILLEDGVSLKGRTVILPAVSAGNVGQLAVDLLIASCNLVSAGHLRDPANMLPCIGNNPYKQGCAECSTEMQLYSGPNAEMMILHQRAPPMLGRQEQAAEALAAILHQQGTAKVIVLGSYSNALPGEDRSSGQAQPMHRMSDRAAFGSVLAADWQQLPDKGAVTDKAYTDLMLPPWPFWRACTAVGLPILLLTLPVDEGDNRGDAMRLASLISKGLGAQAGVDGSLCTFPSSWKVPPSWVVFGEQRAVY